MPKFQWSRCHLLLLILILICAHFLNWSKSHWDNAWVLQRQLQRLEWFFCVVRSRLRPTLTTRKLFGRQWSILAMMIHQRVSLNFHFTTQWRSGLCRGYATTVTGLHARQNFGGLIPGRGRDFSVFHSTQAGSGSHPASYKWILEVKLLGHEVDTSCPSSAEVMNVWCCTCVTPYLLMVCLN